MINSSCFPMENCATPGLLSTSYPLPTHSLGRRLCFPVRIDLGLLAGSVDCCCLRIPPLLRLLEMTYFENGVNSAKCQGVRVQTALPRALPAEESRLSRGPSRSCVYGFVWGAVALFFLFPGPWLLQFIFMLLECRQLVGWACCYVRERQPIRAGLCLSPGCRQLK